MVTVTLRVLRAEGEGDLPTAIIDGIATHYEVRGSGAPLLMFSPGGFDATLEKWTTLGVYARIKALDHLSRKGMCIVFDRRETGRSGGRVERVTWMHYVRQGHGLLQHLNIDRAHVMGGCMGCCAAVAFGVAHPEATLSLLLYWPVGGAKYRMNSHLRFAQHLAYVKQHGLDQVVSLWRSLDKANREAGRGYRCSDATLRSLNRTRDTTWSATHSWSPAWHAACSTGTRLPARSRRTCFAWISPLSSFPAAMQPTPLPRPGIWRSVCRRRNTGTFPWAGRPRRPRPRGCWSSWKRSSAGNGE